MSRCTMAKTRVAGLGRERGGLEVSRAETSAGLGVVGNRESGNLVFSSIVFIVSLVAPAPARGRKCKW